MQSCWGGVAYKAEDWTCREHVLILPRVNNRHQDHDSANIHDTTFWLAKRHATSSWDDLQTEK